MPQATRHWTVEAVHALPVDGNRYEVIDGELFVTPSPRWRHQDAVGELFVLLHDYLNRERIGRLYFAQADVIFSTTRLVQPDVFVVPRVIGRRPEQFCSPPRYCRRVPRVPTESRSGRASNGLDRAGPGADSSKPLG